MGAERKIVWMPPAGQAQRRPRVLVADDDRFYLKVYIDFLNDLGYETLGVENGLEALEKAVAFQPDIVISDVVMPGMDGYELARRLKKDPVLIHVPVLLVTSLSDKASRIKGLEHGADDFLSKPIDEAEFRVRIKNALKVKRYEDYLLEHGKQLEVEVIDKDLQLEKAFEKIRYGYIETVYRLTLAAEYRDRETGGHIKRISLYSQLLARCLGLSEPEVEAIFFASPMHDVGKIGIPDSVLLKQGRHTKEESDVMKTHTTIGADILRDSDSRILITAREIALTHHESWDGKGYPRGLEKEEIPVSGRIVNIVDIYDALRSRRPYKEPLDHQTACDSIREIKERFDPAVFDAFEKCSNDFQRLFDENR